MFDATLMKKAAAAVASTANDSGGDDAPARPLTELLTSPGKHGLLGAGFGGLLGGGAGRAAGQLLSKYRPDLNLTPEHRGLMAAGGLGLGALFGASRAYGSRRRQNDRITDALRRTPPGATLRDYEALQRADDAQKPV